MKHDTILRAAIGTNAAFSAVCGLALLFVPDRVSTLTGLDAGVGFLVLGLGLLVFASGLAVLATRPRMPARWVLAATYSDLLWVAGTVVVLVSPLSASLSERGLWTLAVVGQFVLLFGFGQALGLRLARVSAGART